MMGSVDVNVIVVDVDHPLPMVLSTLPKKTLEGDFVGRAGGNVRPLVFLILDTAK